MNVCRERGEAGAAEGVAAGCELAQGAAGLVRLVEGHEADRAFFFLLLVVLGFGRVVALLHRAPSF